MPDSPSRRPPLMLVGGLLILIALTVFGWYWMRPPAGPSDAALAANNRGVGWMESFEYDQAEAEFEQVVKLAPDWVPGRVNLGMSKYNRATPEKIQQAIQI